jgi:uncharacterized protein (TIGR00369 family)
MAEAEFAGGTRPITQGEWAGWRNWGPDAFEDANGPFVYRERADGSILCAFRAEARHMNGGGFMHGGCMMTFADYAMFCISTKELAGGQAVTVSLNSEFIAPAKVGDLVTATGEIVKAGGSLIFIRGTVMVEAGPILTFSGVIKRIKRRA